MYILGNGDILGTESARDGSAARARGGGARPSSVVSRRSAHREQARRARRVGGAARSARVALARAAPKSASTTARAAALIPGARSRARAASSSRPGSPSSAKKGASATKGHVAQRGVGEVHREHARARRCAPSAAAPAPLRGQHGARPSCSNERRAHALGRRARRREHGPRRLALVERGERRRRAAGRVGRARGARRARARRRRVARGRAPHERAQRRGVEGRAERHARRRRLGVAVPAREVRGEHERAADELRDRGGLEQALELVVRPVHEDGQQVLLVRAGRARGGRGEPALLGEREAQDGGEREDAGVAS